MPETALSSTYNVQRKLGYCEKYQYKNLTLNWYS